MRVHRVRLLLGCVGLTLASGALTWAHAGPDPAGSAEQYGFHGEHTDARGLVDLGQRWYDPRHQVFYSADPAPLDDPLATAADSRLTSSFTLNHHNALSHLDPDGRMPRRLRGGSAPPRLERTPAPPVHVTPALSIVGPIGAPGIPADVQAMPVPEIPPSTDASGNSSMGNSSIGARARAALHVPGWWVHFNRRPSAYATFARSGSTATIAAKRDDGLSALQGMAMAVYHLPHTAEGCVNAWIHVASLDYDGARALVAAYRARPNQPDAPDEPR